MVVQLGWMNWACHGVLAINLRGSPKAMVDAIDGYLTTKHPALLSLVRRHQRLRVYQAITNKGSGTNVNEIANGIYRISTPVAGDVIPGGFTL